MAWAAPCQADPVKGEATLSATDGYARLLLKLSEDVRSEVTAAGSILVIRFERPVDLAIDRLPEAAPDYVSSARRDPDGSAIRLSLARKVTINTMSAGERTFVDLLPEGWRGPPPSLPQEVVRELAERARVAERALRQQRVADEAAKRLPIRVRALVQPTFVRFVFELPNGVGVSSALNEQKLKLLFSSVLSFDLADAKVAAPPNVASIGQRVEGNSTAVDISLIGDVDVHSFREDKNYVLDVGFQPTARLEQQATAENSQVPATAVKRREQPPSSPAAGKIVPPQPMAQIKAEPRSETNSELKPELRSDRNSQPEPEPNAPTSSNATTVEAPRTEAQALNVDTPRPEPLEAPKAEVAAPDLALEAPTKESPPSPVEAVKEPAQSPPAKVAANSVSVDVRRESEGLRLSFAFGTPTPAASFRRGDTIWLVFDSTKPLDTDAIRIQGGAIIGEVSRVPLDTGQAIRLRLNRPLMHSLTSDERASGANWTLTLADRLQTPPQPLSVKRNISDPALANVAVPLNDPGHLHRLPDPDVGDTLLVVTAPPPMRGFVKRQDFVDFSLFESGHGIAIRPNSDEVAVELAPDKVMLGKPGGLTLSSVDMSAERAPTAVRPIFEIDEWHKNREGNFFARKDALFSALAASDPELRSQARLDLARFYMARGFYAEAKGMTDIILADQSPRPDESAVLTTHAVASILIGRPLEGLKDLASPAIGSSFDSQLWKALAYARQGKWADAREKFKNVDFAVAALPLELQRIVTIDAMRASLEVKDYAGAAKRRSDLEVIGVPAELKPAVAVLRGRLAEALGHDRDALDEYRFALNSTDREASAEAKLYEIAVKQRRKEITQIEALRELETLSMTWRGDAIEVKTLGMLARMYNDSNRFAESLAAARQATLLQPNSELSRQAQDAASALFAQIFLSPKGDDVPPIEALAMFYDFRELTPIGRRGDEMIRRLAERLVAVDLLDQAAELLQYQVDHRLEGAARAQVAAKLAMVYLSNRKPDRAIAALSSTRIADLSGELRQQRLLLEARAQSDIGRHDLALDIIANISGREAIRLRSDVYWAARRWRESSEQIELYYGDRWRDAKPLSGTERGDIIRAAVGYALAEDAIGLSRFREKYAPLMTGEADRQAFDIASKPSAGSSAEFAEIARMAASVDTLDGFLREMKARFPDATARAPVQPQAKSDPVTTGALPQIIGMSRAETAK